jgi:hypothetical protein
MNALLSKVRDCPSHFTGSEMEISFRGLSSMTDKDACAIHMIDALNAKSLDLSTVEGENIPNILSVLSNFNGEHVTVQRALSHVHRMLETVRPKMLPRSICLSFQSMLNFDSHCAEAVNIVGTLTSAIHQDGRWCVSEVVPALSGLKRMNFGNVVVRSALVALTSQLTNSTGRLTVPHAQIIVKSLADKNPSYPEIRELLLALAERLRSDNPRGRGGRIASILRTSLGSSNSVITPGALSEALNAVSGDHWRTADTSSEPVGDSCSYYNEKSLFDYARRGRIAALLPYLEDIAEKMISGSSPVAPDELARIMYGIKSIPLETPGLLMLVNAIVAKTKVCEIGFMGAI